MLLFSQSQEGPKKKKKDTNLEGVKISLHNLPVCLLLVFWLYLIN